VRLGGGAMRSKIEVEEADTSVGAALRAATYRAGSAR